MKDNLLRFSNACSAALILTLVFGMLAALFTSINMSRHIDDRRSFELIEQEFQVIERQVLALEHLHLKCYHSLATCNPEQINVLINEEFMPSINVIKQLAGNEDSWFTKRHEEGLDQLVIATVAYSTNPNDASLEAVKTKLDHMRSLHESLNNSLIDHSTESINVFLWGLLLFSIICFIALALLLAATRQQRANVAEENSLKWGQVVLANQTLANGQSIRDVIDSYDLDPSVQGLLMRYDALQKSLDDYSHDVQLFRKINKSINYEFRTLTNTISGGLRLLSNEIEGKSVVLANEMIQSTAVLDELANNFLGIFGESNSDMESDVHEIVDQVLSMLRAKSERNNQQLECYVSRYVSDTLQVSPIKLLWTIYLELAKVIDVYRNKKIVLIFDSDREQGNVRRVLDVKIYFVNTMSRSLGDLDASNWLPPSKVEYCYSDLIFGSNVPSSYTIAKNQQGEICYRLTLKLMPASTRNPAPTLKGHTYMLCGSSNLQNDIIEKTVRQAGGDVIPLSAPAAAFKSILDYPEISGVIVTDTVAGIEYKSFLKTLRSRMISAKHKAKLILSLSSKEFDMATTDFVDRVVLRPNSPNSFIHALQSVLPEQEDSQQSSEPKILCIDDDPTHGFILTEILEAGGWPAEHFENPRTAVNFVLENHVKIIFMDCVMPDMDGFEATRLIRQAEADQDARQPITIIGATGLTSVSEMNACIEAGMDYVINKPYSQEEIYRVLKTYIAARKVS